IPPVVRAAFPRGVIAAVVTGQARLADFGRRDLSELPDVPFRVIVHVGLAGTVATLAALGRGRRTRVFHVGVLCALQRFFFVGVARHAGVAAGVASLRCRRCGLTGRCLQSSRGTRRDGAPSTNRERSCHYADRNCRFHRSAIRKFARSYAAGSGIRPRLMLPRISDSELHSFSTIQASISPLIVRSRLGPWRSKADTNWVTWAP